MLLEFKRGMKKLDHNNNKSTPSRTTSAECVEMGFEKDGVTKSKAKSNGNITTNNLKDDSVGINHHTISTAHISHAIREANLLSTIKQAPGYDLITLLQEAMKSNTTPDIADAANIRRQRSNSTTTTTNTRTNKFHSQRDEFNLSPVAANTVKEPPPMNRKPEIEGEC